MIEEAEYSELQQFYSEKNFISRQVHSAESTGNNKYEQISTWNIEEFIKTQIKETSTKGRLEIQTITNLIHTLFAQLNKRFESELAFTRFMAELRTVIQEKLKAVSNPSFIQNTYLSFCNVFLRQCIYYILALLHQSSLIDLNKYLKTPLCLLFICLKETHKRQEFKFSLTLETGKKQQDTGQPSKQKDKHQQGKHKAQNENKAAEDQQENHSQIEPLIFQKEDQSEEAILMEYFKALFPNNNFIILVSNKSHIYLLNKAEKLGQGGFGSVFKSQQLRLVNQQYHRSFWAIKELRKNTNSTNKSIIGQERQHEILTIISKLSRMKVKSSRNIIQVQEVIKFESKKYIVYEFCPAKDLRKFIRTNDQLTKKHLFMIIEQLAATLTLIHYELINNETDMEILGTLTPDEEITQDNNNNFKDKMYLNLQVGIIHRDLKLTNILVSYFSQSQIRIKIIDWAFSKRTLTDKKICKIQCGTLNYQAPEILNKKLYCSKVDVWAFGAIVYQLFTGQQFVHKDDKEKLKKDDTFVKSKLQKMKFRTDKYLSKQQVIYWKQLICKCLQYKPDKRFSSKEALDFIRKCGFYKPWTAQDIFYIQQLKMMSANYFYHHNRIMQLRPASTLRIKILNTIAVYFQSFMQQIYQKFSHEKYWNSEKPEIIWEYKKSVGRYKQKKYKKQSFEQYLQMLFYVIQQYPQSKAFNELVVKVKKYTFN